MLITHEFPLQFYLDGTAESSTDYDYCLAHRYLNNENYRSFMKRQVTKLKEESYISIIPFMS